MISTVMVSQLGMAYIPPKYSTDNGSVRAFDVAKGINKPSQYLKRGGSVVLMGSWCKVVQANNDLLRHEQDIIGHIADRRERQLAQRAFPLRLLTELTTVKAQLNVEPEVLAGLCGSDYLPEVPVLLPVCDAAKLIARLEHNFYVPSINASLVVHPEVLIPQSRETIELMHRAMRECAQHLPPAPHILDMGCGSGVLSIAAAMNWPSGLVTATDILPEAVATTRLNAQRLVNKGQITDSICVTKGGDLFDPVSTNSYDLIVFNAPWVMAPAANRAELALNDNQQSTLRRFLFGCRSHLRPGGLVIVGYADNSGPKAIEGLEVFAKDAGLEIRQILKDRIKTYRAKRSWQNIYSYILQVN